jgi:hypothetical protein
VHARANGGSAGHVRGEYGHPHPQGILPFPSAAGNGIGVKLLSAADCAAQALLSKVRPKSPLPAPPSLRQAANVWNLTSSFRSPVRNTCTSDLSLCSPPDPNRSRTVSLPSWCESCPSLPRTIPRACFIVALRQVSILIELPSIGLPCGFYAACSDMPCFTSHCHSCHLSSLRLASESRSFACTARSRG